MKRKQIYEARIAELAGILAGDPARDTPALMKELAARYGKSLSTVRRWRQQARMRVAARTNPNAHESRNDEATSYGPLSRDEALEILSRIARGEVRQVKVQQGEVKFVTPTDAQRISALKQIAKMEGWDLPTDTHEFNNTHVPFVVNVIEGNAPPLLSDESEIETVECARA